MSSCATRCHTELQAFVLTRFLSSFPGGSLFKHQLWLFLFFPSFLSFFFVDSFPSASIILCFASSVLSPSTGFCISHLTHWAMSIVTLSIQMTCHVYLHLDQTTMTPTQALAHIHSPWWVYLHAMKISLIITGGDLLIGQGEWGASALLKHCPCWENMKVFRISGKVCWWRFWLLLQNRIVNAPHVLTLMLRKINHRVCSLQVGLKYRRVLKGSASQASIRLVWFIVGVMQCFKKGEITFD